MKSKRLWHNTWGEPSSPSLIFLHGFIGSHLDFLPIIEKLADDFFCIAFDLPGHGHSKQILPKTIFDFESIILESLKKYSLKKPTLIGYSMGGRISINLYDKLRPSSLILISTRILRAHEKEASLIKKRNEILSKSLLQDPYTLFLEKWYSSPLFTTIKDNRSIYNKMIEERKNQKPKALAYILELLSPKDYKPSLSFIKNLKEPLLYICGKKDTKYFKVSKKIRVQNKQAWIYTHSNASHALHIEDPENISHIIKQFHRYYHG